MTPPKAIAPPPRPPVSDPSRIGVHATTGYATSQMVSSSRMIR
jgi:hypothetical protein